MDDGCDLVTLSPPGAARPAVRDPGGTGGDEPHRRDPAAGHGGRQRPAGIPVVAVNEALTKHLFDNRYGTGQSTLGRGVARHELPESRDGRRGGRRLLAGAASRHRRRASGGWGPGRGREVDQVRALEALMDGNLVMTMRRRGPVGRDLHHGHRRIHVNPGPSISRSCAMVRSRATRPLRCRARPAGAQGAGRGRIREVRKNVEEYDLGDRRINVLARAGSSTSAPPRAIRPR